MTDELLRVLLYFDIFSYPLTKREIIRYSGIAGKRRNGVDRALERLQSRGFINHYGGLYYVGDKKQNVARRLHGNSMAAGRMKTARRFSRLISWFPFVRGVFISGALAKGYAVKHDDIDYFIVTEPGRLWLVRSLLILFKKVFLLNSYRNFCINYFVDSEHLFIKEHNRFTATEIVFLIPLFNHFMYDRLLEENNWVRDYYPNFVEGTKYDCYENVPALKRWFEKMLSGSLTGKIENYLYQKSRSYIRDKFSYLDEENFSRRFRLLRHELRYLPGNQQFKTMDKYEERVLQFMKKNGVPAVGGV